MTDSRVADVLAEIASWRDGKLWGAPAIARDAMVSVDTVVRWAALPDCPITKPSGTYFVVRNDLMTWLRQKKCA